MTPHTIPGEIPLEEARAILGDLCIAASEHDARILITRYSKPAAQLVRPGVGIPTPEQIAKAQAAFDLIRGSRDYGHLFHQARAAINQLGELLDTLNGNPREQA